MKESLKFENSHSPSTSIASEMDRYESQITGYVAGLKYEDLTEEAVETAKERYVDSFAVALAAYDTGPVEAMKKLALQSCFETGATLPGSRHKAPVDYATMRPGTMIRALDWNDTYLNRETADHSLPYIVAVALLDGEITLKQFGESHLQNQALHELIQKVTVSENKKYTNMYGNSFPNKVIVAMKNGTPHEKEALAPKGHPNNPLTRKELEEKFRVSASPLLSGFQQDEILETLWNLEELEDIGKLIKGFEVK